ncbi:alpha-2,8-sialyltransferase 8F-like isoform X2 [Hemicordylus capensis]|uniref:alpha-2,8-sialyltransferase 8F-like isoform X2 n=1 Tax=Hemicordylus capensis TaxID=884348 RepID=UPI002304C904|nr:alpha-2,8-sialyltransferase 8F-like isoform X2 [Hemicordylus capensis]XP_053121158.1 alpha-2,8-sialyltransferase 8F-like isoform X2 [Hemicordylus capensis]XP_053121159.1 alpha-2,8-sialyltransferase 8F-like isoform X2 [Hemicordylus capensis]XP_053121160.1 alpha-2,8-sialyltransferase 8F-like isoform X2 [Hemicordylus capensis]
MVSNIRLRKSHLLLWVSVCFLASLMLSLLQRTNRAQAALQALAKCQELQRFLQTKNALEGSSPKLGSIQSAKILGHLQLIQGCPWKPNPTAVAHYRTKLGQCCNASFWLLVTKENTPVGSHLISDVNKNWKQSVKAELVDLLPERSPFSDTQYGRCAVVGSGGILRNSGCGQEIDQADLIVRFNMPPMNFSEDVGTKTSLVTINPTILEKKYTKLSGRRKPFADAVSAYRGAFFIIPAFSFPGHASMAYRALYATQDFGLAGQVTFLNPHYLEALSNYWRGQNLQPNRLSTGFMFVNVALELCQHITLYGFWPFQHGLDNQPILHHYFDNMLPKPGVHAMPSEFSHYLAMYAQGALHLRLGKCQQEAGDIA